MGSEFSWVYCIVFINNTLLTFPPKELPYVPSDFSLGTSMECRGTTGLKKGEGRPENLTASHNEWGAELGPELLPLRVEPMFKPFFWSGLRSLHLKRWGVPGVCSPELTQHESFEDCAGPSALLGAWSRRALLGKFCF